MQAEQSGVWWWWWWCVCMYGCMCVWGWGGRGETAFNLLRSAITLFGGPSSNEVSKNVLLISTSTFSLNLFGLTSHSFCFLLYSASITFTPASPSEVASRMLVITSKTSEAATTARPTQMYFTMLPLNKGYNVHRTTGWERTELVLDTRSINQVRQDTEA